MKSVRKVTSMIAAVGAGALGVGLISLGTGVGAQFTDSGTASAKIATGTFSCQLSSTDTSVVISNSGHTATVDLGTINSSAASSQTAPVTVTNTGSIPLATTWSENTTGNILGGSGAISAIPAAASLPLAPGAKQTVSIGFSWTALSNSDLNRSGTAVYTVTCNDVKTQIVKSAALQYSGTGWGGWSCPAGTLIVSAEAVDSNNNVLTMGELDLWRPGAVTSGSVAYPNTPFGYTYTPPEQGAIAQNNGNASPIYLVLTCTT